MINTVAAKAHLEAQLMELKERQDRIAQDLASRSIPISLNKRSKWRRTFRLRASCAHRASDRFRDARVDAD